MAENKKYLDLNGLKYAVRKMDAKKADIESPDFSGTPTINGEEIATKADIPGNYVVNSSENDETTLIKDNSISMAAEEGTRGEDDVYRNAGAELSPQTVWIGTVLEVKDNLSQYNGIDIEQGQTTTLYAQSSSDLSNTSVDAGIDLSADSGVYLRVSSQDYSNNNNNRHASVELNTVGEVAVTGVSFTYNGEEIATKEDINNSDLKGEKGDKPVITAEAENITESGVPGVHTSFYADGEDLVDFTVMDGEKGARGTSLLHVNTAPWANTHQTPDGIIHNMSLKQSEVLAEAKADELYLGDIIEWNGFIYQVTYLGDPFSATLTGQGAKIVDVYVDSIGNIKGPQGIQGIQGEQGPQGPKGDPGEGYFLVTDEDYAKIADFIEEKSYHSYQRPDASEPIRPNIFYDFGPQYQLEITFEAPQSIYRSNEYMFQFESPSDRPTTLIMPSSVKWCYDPVIEAGKTYQVSVLNDLAVICGA